MKLLADDAVLVGGAPPSHAHLVFPAVYGDYVEVAAPIISATVLRDTTPAALCPAVFAHAQAAAAALDGNTADLTATTAMGSDGPGQSEARTRVHGTAVATTTATATATAHATANATSATSTGIVWRGGCHIVVARMPSSRATHTSLWLHGFLFDEFQASGRRSHFKVPHLALLSGQQHNVAEPPVACAQEFSGTGGNGRQADSPPQWLPTNGDFGSADQHLHYVGDNIGTGRGTESVVSGHTGVSDTAMPKGHTHQDDRTGGSSGSGSGSGSGGWSCGICTLLNTDATAQSCEVCGSGRGQQAVPSAHICFGSDTSRIAPSDPDRLMAFWAAAVDTERQKGLIACIILLPHCARGASSRGGADNSDSVRAGTSSSSSALEAQIATAATVQELAALLHLRLGKDGAAAAALLEKIQAPPTQNQ